MTARAGPVAAGEAYTRQEVLTLPENISGTFQLLVQTDAASQLFERDGENNNVQSDDQLLEVSLSPRADLQVAAVVVPETAGALTTIGVEWEVINLGTAEPNRPFWTDRVYLSLDSTRDNSDQLVGSVGNPSTLRPGESYLQSLAGISSKLNQRAKVAEDGEHEITSEGECNRRYRSRYQAGGNHDFSPHMHE